MATHDPLFKVLLKAFFPEFIDLFYPEIAARLDFSRLTFLDKEAFTDFPEGSRREMDLVAQVHSKEGEPEIILVHIEVESARRAGFSRQMFQYYAQMRLRYPSPVLPIVLYLAPGAGGLVHETFEESLFGDLILTFRYRCVGLPDLTADRYLEIGNPLAPALSALMKFPKRERMERALDLLKRIARQQSIDAAQRSILVHVVDSYLKLSTIEMERFMQTTEQEIQSEIRAFLAAVEAERIEKGLKKQSPIWEAFEKIQRQYRYGVILGKRDSLLMLLRSKLTPLPDEVAEYVTSLETEEEVDSLFQKALIANTVEELEIPHS